MNLAFINQKLQTARYSLDVFGALNGNQDEQCKQLKSLFHSMAKVTHADLFNNDEDKKIAHEAFIKLMEWYERGLKDIVNDRYSNPEPL